MKYYYLPFENGIYFRVIFYIVYYYIYLSLPVMMNENGDIVDVEVSNHGYAWIKVVSSHFTLTNVVETVLDENPLFCQHLSKTTDDVGRIAIDVAIPECRALILFSLYFFKRYEILTIKQPHYQSLTCVVHLAVDHQNDNENKHVALKFMKIKETFLNEISIRSKSQFDSLYVIDIINYYDCDTNEEFKKYILRKGFEQYPYLIVMPVGDRNLNEIVSNGELLEKSDLHFIRAAIVEIARCLHHLHSRNIVHGDLKVCYCFLL